MLGLAALALPVVACSEKLPYLLPAFPMPPPRASASATLKPGLVVRGGSEDFGDVYGRIKEALERARFTGWMLYWFADDGFAVATRMEQIGDDGRPTPQRFTVRRPAYGPDAFSIADYKQALFNAEPGRYRVIVLIVTARPLSPQIDHPPMLQVDARDLAKGDMPEEMRDRPAPNGRCEVLVFEFLRPADTSLPAVLQPSRVTALDHLARAGMWDASQLR
jgi:hypothetical protein